jgi:hypothetical protein
MLDKVRMKILLWLDNRTRLLMWLDRGSIGGALAAALFWWLSARVPLPAPLPHLTQTPDDDPFFMALRHSADLSSIAAGFTGLAVFLTAIASWVRNCQTWLPPRLFRLLKWFASYKEQP